MQFGVMLPHRWLYAGGNTIADFAYEAEALGTPRCGSRTISLCPPTGWSEGTSSMKR